MKLFFVALFLIVTVYYVNGIRRINHDEDDISTIGIENATKYANQKCDYRRTTPFEGKTWWFCTKKGLYAIMGRFTLFGEHTQRTNIRCYTSEDCQLTEDSTDVCVNIGNEVRACYIDPFIKPAFPRNKFALLLLDICCMTRMSLTITLVSSFVLMITTRRKNINIKVEENMEDADEKKKEDEESKEKKE